MTRIELSLYVLIALFLYGPLTVLAQTVVAPTTQPPAWLFEFESIPPNEWGPVHADAQYPQRDAQLFRYVFDIPGQYVNDHCLVYAQGLWHLFFIQGDVAKPGEVWSRPGNEVKIGHGVSRNLLAWDLLEPALTVSSPGHLDSGHVYAPNVIEHEGKYHMFYTGLIEERFGMRIFLATSDDLHRWEKHVDNPIFKSDPNWAAYRPVGYEGTPPGPCGCRDPHVIRHPEHGFILYFAEHLKADPQKGSKPWEYAYIGAATSKDLINWRDRGPVLVRHRRLPERSRSTSPESPCVLFHNRMYYLFWKSGSGIRYVMSDDPLDFNDREAYFLGT
ncbi:MAG: glycoside hydrolase family protein, partial [Planctomycetota bacterium]